MANSKRGYPQVASIQDQAAQQSVRLLWDKVHDAAAKMADLESQLTAANGTISTLQTGMAGVQTQVNQALITSGSPLVTILPIGRRPLPSTGGGGGGTGGGGGGTGGGGGGGGGTDPPPPPNPGPPGILTHGFNLATAAIYNSPSDIATWPATATISRVDISPSIGVFITFSTAATWPDYTPPGWSGPLQYTVWMMVKVSGTWDASGFIEMWKSREGTGSVPVGSEFAKNWAYDARWGPMNGYLPAIGEQVGFLVSAGDARNNGGTVLKERSEVVLLNLPDAGGATYT